MYQNSPLKGGGSCHKPTSWLVAPTHPQAWCLPPPSGQQAEAHSLEFLITIKGFFTGKKIQNMVVKTVPTILD